MTWAERLKRIFNIDITICSHCSGAVRIIACIDDPLVIKKILAHLDAKSGGGHRESNISATGTATEELLACPISVASALRVLIRKTGRG